MKRTALALTLMELLDSTEERRPVLLAHSSVLPQHSTVLGALWQRQHERNFVKRP